MADRRVLTAVVSLSADLPGVPFLISGGRRSALLHTVQPGAMNKGEPALCAGAQGFNSCPLLLRNSRRIFSRIA
jgi:hypothetical protein